MTHRAFTFLSLSAVAAALLIAAPAAAQSAECQPGDLFCAELHLGPGSGRIRIGPGADAQPLPPPPPPVVVQPQPQPPVVIVEPQPQPYYAPPPPPVQQPPQVYVQPAPPPPPQVMYVPPVRQRVRRERPSYPYSSLGLNLNLSGIWGENLAMGGGGAAFRIRPIPHVAIDLGAGLYGGNDYNGLERWEVPVTADVLFFFNPQNRFQFYALVGVGASISHAEGQNRFTLLAENRDYFHLGGEVGLGLEWRMGRVFALSLDARGFIRHRVDDSAEPEFTEPSEDGGWQSTDLSGGVTTRVGMTFYFD